MGKGSDLLCFAAQEFGTTTERPRCCGWLDIVALRYYCQISGFASLNLTKLDVLLTAYHMSLSLLPTEFHSLFKADDEADNLSEC
ncbi:Adenylosuccinate synthetase, chloroplastic [Capsicum chinense]|nr:Adenylosuccinate synthetase, chloroplastic [Capsicum chinense]